MKISASKTEALLGEAAAEAISELLKTHDCCRLFLDEGSASLCSDALLQR